MTQATSDVQPRKLGRRPNLKGAGPITRAAASLGISVSDLARKLKVNQWTLRAWDRKDRRIPDDITPRLNALLAARRTAKKV